VTKLHELYERHGQSPWIDNLRRDWLNDGTLAALVDAGVRGVTSNPAIFARALATSSAYDAHLGGRVDADAERVFEDLAAADVRDACDVLAPTHRRSRDQFVAGARRYADGHVSLEVSPRLAHDSDATVDAALRLARAVDRQNLLVKIPATLEGLDAIAAVLGEGVSVNVTLIFSLARYDQVIDAWLDGMELALARGRDLREISSVASFFVSRVDAAVDSLLADDDPRRGATANAQAAAAYQLYRTRVVADRVAALLARGAQVQRPLWASTSTKNPSYQDLLYVNALVGEETVNTLPDATLAAVLDHGAFEESVLADPAATARAARLLDGVRRDIDLDEVTRRLEAEGVDAFVNSYEELLGTVSAKLARTSA
jgi:transaldolase